MDQDWLQEMREVMLDYIRYQGDQLKPDPTKVATPMRAHAQAVGLHRLLLKLQQP